MKVMFFLALPLAATLMACNPDTRHYSVRVVVPAGYHGLVRIRFNASGEPRDWDGKTLVLRIPASGILITQAENPFLKWGQGLDVLDTAGKKIPCSFRLKEPATDAILFRSVGGTNDGKEYWAVIGTQQEAIEASISLDDYESHKNHKSNR
jgi:hypothetical protein